MPATRVDRGLSRRMQSGAGYEVTPFPFFSSIYSPTGQAVAEAQEAEMRAMLGMPPRASRGGRGGGGRALHDLPDHVLEALAANAPTEDDLRPEVIINPHAPGESQEHFRRLEEDPEYRREHANKWMDEQLAAGQYSTVQTTDPTTGDVTGSAKVSGEVPFSLVDPDLRSRARTPAEQRASAAQGLVAAKKRLAAEKEQNKLRTGISERVWNKTIDYAAENGLINDPEFMQQMTEQQLQSFGPGAFLPDPALMADVAAKEDSPEMKLSAAREKILNRFQDRPEYADAIQLGEDGNIDYRGYQELRGLDIKEQQNNYKLLQETLKTRLGLIENLYDPSSLGPGSQISDLKALRNARREEIEKTINSTYERFGFDPPIETPFSTRPAGFQGEQRNRTAPAAQAAPKRIQGASEFQSWLSTGPAVNSPVEVGGKTMYLHPDNVLRQFRYDPNR